MLIRLLLIDYTMSATEDGISGLMAEYLRSCDISAVTQVSISTPGTRSQPDFQITNGGTYVGEAKWEDNKWEGFGEARDYGQLAGVSGSFLITYPNELKQEGTQARLTDNVAESVLSGHTYSCAFLRRDEPTDMVQLELEEIPGWIKDNIEQRRSPEPNPDEVVSVLRQTARTLNEELQSSPDENLFRNVLGAEPEEEEEQKAARQTAGFLLTNQITFYRVLSASQEFPEIDPDKLGKPSDLSEYFDIVLEVDYTPVFSFRIANELPQDSIEVLRDTIKTIYALSPENVNHDVLGKVFHELIPVSARKQIAAYYTKSKPAELLAHLAINSADDKVIDPACGSGTLLAASYMRKRQLMDGAFNEKAHQKFVEKDLTGIDVMPFAAHLSCIHLALQAPLYETDEVNIGIEDSTKLQPGSVISPLSFVLPQSDEQRSLTEFDSDDGADVSDDAVEAGSVAMDAAVGKEMELETADVVIMNPPFSRQESVAGFAENYKSRLRDRFSRRDNRGHIHGKMSYCSYFMFFADKFLDEGGRIAAVIPATVLNKSSDAGVREMLINEYDIEYAFAREDNPNFSEDTDLREVMIIARKGNEEDSSATYISLDGLDIDADSLKSTADALQNDTPGEIRTVENGVNKATLWRIPETQLDTHNLFSPFAVSNRRLIQVWTEMQNDDSLTQVQNLTPGLTRGGSSHPWTNGILGAPDTQLRKSDVWRVQKTDTDSVTVQHRFIEEEITIPKTAVEPYFLRKPYRKRLDVSDIDEFTVVREFEAINRFLQLAEEPEIPDGWEDHVTENASHTSIPETVDLTAPGTCHPIYYSDNPRIYHRMWMHSNLDSEDSKLMALWFDSSFGIIQFLLTRVPGRGGWTKYRKYTQERFKTLNPEEIDDDEKDELIDVFETVSNDEAPSLVKQMALNANPDEFDDNTLEKIEQYYEGLSDAVGDGYEPRKKTDKAILSTLNIEDDRASEMLNTVYTDILLELVELKEMMD